ncbi:MAG: hypothetical protein KDA28_03775, partial [Phycisphaerales bacterium]|nr:hypothetical protein [Phycisphaerales bacterium]
ERTLAVANRLDAAPIVRADLIALSIPHCSRVGDFDGAARLFREGLDLVDEASGDLEWSRPYLHLWYGRALLEQGRVTEAITELEHAKRGLCLRYGEEGYNSQFAFEALSLSRHASQSAAEARRLDARELDLVRADPASGPRRHTTTAWCVARVPGHDAAVYRDALASARFADQALSGTWLARRAVALAAYRCGEFQEAIDAVRSLHTTTRGERPGLRAVEAMAMAALGDRDAVALHRRAMAMGSESEFSHDLVTRALLDESRTFFERLDQPR